MSLRLGVDVGGTFTDLLLHDTVSGRLWVAKTPSTPHDQAIGVLEGIHLLARHSGLPPESLTAILHGTTVATNAVLERRGARVGMIVTEGFQHILHLAEAWTPGPLFGFMVYDKPEPIADVDVIGEVSERIDPTGTVLEPLQEEATRRTIIQLRDRGVDALTVCLINSFANPAHEERVAELVHDLAPELPVSLSSDVLPEFREYERALTTLVNAYVAPALDRYLSSLRERLARERITASLQVVRSDGGLMSLDSARHMPVQTVLSGPAGGVRGASFVASRAGYDRILTFDMGGTSTDVAVAVGGSALVTRETKVGDFPVRAPALEVESIGAGGGSIAYVAAATGALRVGPRSAGADPGPACYGRGGTEPTVTDANVVLGHLPPRLLDGEMALDVDAAHAAVASVAKPLGLSVPETARGIIDLVNESMLGALRVVTVQKGRSPSEFALVSFGGAGGLHANALASLLGSFPVIIPPEPGVLSAMGFVASEIKNELSSTHIRPVDDLRDGELEQEFAGLVSRARRWLEAENVGASDQSVDRIVDMRYHGQGFELSIPLEDGVASVGPEALRLRFGAEHRRLYGFELEEGAEVVCLRTVARGRVTTPEIEPEAFGDPDPSEARRSSHRVWTAGGAIDVPTYARSALRAGMCLPGYAIVEQYDATTVVLPGHVATVDPWLNLIIVPQGSQP